MNIFSRGRKKEFEKRIVLPITEEMLARIDERCGVGQSRVEYIRKAISASFPTDEPDTLIKVANPQYAGDDEEYRRHVRASITQSSDGSFHYFSELHFWGEGRPKHCGKRDTLEEARSAILHHARHDSWADVVIIVETFQAKLESDVLDVNRCVTFVCASSAFEPVSEGIVSMAEHLLNEASETLKRLRARIQREAQEREIAFEQAFNF